MTAERIASPRIFRVEYSGSQRRDERGRFLPRIATAWVKVPYGALFGLSETLVRAMTTGQVRWFRIETAQPGEVTPEVRAQLTRWPDALAHTSGVTAVEWTR